MVAPSEAGSVPAATDEIPDSHMDCILQLPSNTLSYRLALYHADLDTRHRLYPEGGAEDVLELGAPVAGRDQLVLFRRLAVSPLDFKRWLDASFVRHSCTRAYFVGEQQATSRQELVRQLIEGNPPPGPVRVYAFPKALERYLADSLLEAPRWDLHPVKYEYTLHAVTTGSDCIRYAVRPASETFLTPYEGPRRVAGQTCKAAGKLAEALHVTGFKPAGNGVAIDVGAAPGGWTEQLARSMHRVVAVDPAELDPAVAALPNVTHIKKKSEDAIEEISVAVDDAGVDLLVSDVNRHPDQVEGMLAPLKGLLRPGGLMIVTMKFRGKGREKADEAKIIKALCGGFTSPKMLWCLANTSCERTLVAIKQDAVEEANGV